MTRTIIRPRLEVLEDRTLMSTCHVTRLSDIGAGMGFRGDFRYCINKVNAEPGADIIMLHRTGTINLNSALPELASDIDIQGPGADLLTVRRNTGGEYRIFTVTAGAIVEISGLTVRDGYASNGGGIRNDGSLALDQVIVRNNLGRMVGRGGGIYNEGSLSIRASTISNNLTDTAGSPYVGEGGGIYNRGELTVIESTLTNNQAKGISSYGGAIFNHASGTLTLLDSSISSNKAFPLGLGGGIWNHGSTSVYNSTINDNEADVIGGGILNGGNSGTLVLFNSTVHGNFGGDSGGGVIASGALTVISYSTISGNVIDSATNAGGIDATNGLVFMRNTIIAGNSDFDLEGELTSSGYNLIGNSGGGSGYAPTDILDVDPMLGPLQDNGGPTLTHALLPGSPAIDAGDNADAPDFDQRGPGFPRIVNVIIDIGAFEVQSTGAPALAPGSRTPFGNPFPETLFRESVPRPSVEQSRRIETEFLEGAFPNGVRERGEAADNDASISPLQDLVHRATTRPRVLPWADVFRPVAEIDVEIPLWSSLSDSPFFGES